MGFGPAPLPWNQTWPSSQHVSDMLRLPCNCLTLQLTAWEKTRTNSLCRKCVCLGRGDAKQFSAKTRKPENAKTDRKTRKPRKPRKPENPKTRKRTGKRENRENAKTAKTGKSRKRHLYTMIYVAKVIEDDVLKAQHEGWSGICSKDHYHII